MSLTLAPTDRERGLIYLDPALTTAPATHALIIGCGRFAAPTLPPVTSPPVSARKVAGWFLEHVTGRSTAGFANSDRPLASLAVVLSEAADGALSQIEGGPVPRATFAVIKQAVRDWAARADLNNGSMMFLFMASHGQSFNRQTAILCEDYGADTDDEFAGMTEVEQFVEAIANLDVAEKLMVFDCCRTPGALPQNPDGLYGSRFMAKKVTSHAAPRRPQVLRSTVIGKEAYGLPARPTLFTQALLDALGGLAADYNEDWQIATDRLASVTERLLGLHQLDDERLQEPEFQLTAAFQVAQATATDRVTLYVSLDAPLDLTKGRLEMMCDGVVQGAALPLSPPFMRFDLPGGQSFVIRVLDEAGVPVAETKPFSPQLPLAFRRLPDSRGIQIVRSKSLDLTPGPSVLALNIGPHSRGVARISDLAGHSLSLAGETQSVEVAPGTHRVVFTRPDGRLLTTDVAVGPGETITLDMPESVRGSPREWLIDAVQAGVISADARPGPGAMGFATEKIQAISGTEVAALVTGGLTDAVTAPDLKLIRAQSDGRFFLYNVDDTLAERLRAQNYGAEPTVRAADFPVWVVVRTADWREVGFLPTLGQQGKWLQMPGRGADPWGADVLIDMAADNASHLITYVRNQRWAMLLAFLARRDFVGGGSEYEALFRDNTLQVAIMEKVSNPLAAFAAALIGVGTGQVEMVGVAQNWLRNLVNWFPGVPDGPVILARHLLARGEANAAAALLNVAFARGVPVFSLSVDWLAQGMAALDLAGADEARRWSRLVDPGRTFSVLRLPR